MESSRKRVLLFTNLESRFTRGIFQGAMAFARHRTNWRMVCQNDLHASELRNMRLSGILSLKAEVTELERLDQIPLVLIGNVMRDFRASSIAVDEPAIGTLAANYFAGLGLKHFAFVGHGDWPFIAERLKGFENAVANLGHGPIDKLVGFLYDRRRMARFIRDLEAMLQSLPRPCGLLAANDSLGVKIIETCQMLGLRVPDDVAVLGVDDDEMACELSEIPLSSIQQPLFEIGYEAARLLQQHMEQPDKPPVRMLVPPLRVVPRASSDLFAMDDEDVISALRLINEHASEPINVDWVLRQLPVARRTLQRKFKTMVGRTLLEQIRHVRFEKAKELLIETDLTLDWVARQSGFSNVRWLADCFREELKVTPGRYRRQFRTQS